MLAPLTCLKKKKITAIEKIAGMEASMTFSAKYVKRALEVTDSKEAAAKCRVLPNAAPAASTSSVRLHRMGYVGRKNKRRGEGDP